MVTHNIIKINRYIDAICSYIIMVLLLLKIKWCVNVFYFNSIIHVGCCWFCFCFSFVISCDWITYTHVLLSFRLLFWIICWNVAHHLRFIQLHPRQRPHAMLRIPFHFEMTTLWYRCLKIFVSVVKIDFIKIHIYTV